MRGSLMGRRSTCTDRRMAPPKVLAASFSGVEATSRTREVHATQLALSTGLPWWGGRTLRFASLRPSERQLSVPEMVETSVRMGRLPEGLSMVDGGRQPRPQAMPRRCYEHPAQRQSGNLVWPRHTKPDYVLLGAPSAYGFSAA
jgi:hypothetical protein